MSFTWQPSTSRLRSSDGIRGIFGDRPERSGRPRRGGRAFGWRVGDRAAPPVYVPKGARQSRRRGVRRIRTGKAGGVGRVSVQSMLQRPNPHVQSLDDLFQCLVLRPQTLVVSLKPRVLGFEFFYPSLESSAVCFHPLVLKVEHAGAENDSSEMRAQSRRPAAVNSSLWEVDAYICAQGLPGDNPVARIFVRIPRFSDRSHLELPLVHSGLTQVFPPLECLPKFVVYFLFQGHGPPSTMLRLGSLSPLDSRLRTSLFRVKIVFSAELHPQLGGAHLLHNISLRKRQ